jgi:hypothetical protein
LEELSVLEIEDENQRKTVMTEATQTPKSTFRPIYPATIVPGVIQNETNAKGDPYLVIRESQVTSIKSGKTSTRTVMVFGKSVGMVQDLLETGVAVDLAVQNDGGSVKIIGPVLAPKVAAEG